MTVQATSATFPGAPYEPSTANPMTEGVGPAAYADRVDRPDLTVHGEHRIVPMRVATDFYVEPRDPDPRGMTVVALDGVAVGVVQDLWVDRAEPQVRYLEVEVTGAARTALVPITMARIHAGRGEIAVRSIKAAHFAEVPALRAPDAVTLLEEDKIQAYFAGGYLYADPQRQEPIL